MSAVMTAERPVKAKPRGEHPQTISKADNPVEKSLLLRKAIKRLDDATHAATCDLYAFATVLDGFLGASEPPPLEMLRDWVTRIAGNLDDANLALPRDGGVA